MKIVLDVPGNVLEKAVQMHLDGEVPSVQQYVIAALHCFGMILDGEIEHKKRAGVGAATSVCIGRTGQIDSRYTEVIADPRSLLSCD